MARRSSAHPPALPPPEVDTTEAAATWEAIDSLVPWNKNPRDNEKAVAEVARSIRRFGFASPIIARSANREIIAGHTRYLAAQRLGMTRVPVRFVNLDPGEAHALALADNRVGEIADWSDDLAQILRDLADEDVDIRGLGWTDEELAKIVDEDEPEFAPDESDLLGGDTFQVLIEADNESHQAELLERLTKEGLRCRALMS